MMVSGVVVSLCIAATSMVPIVSKVDLYNGRQVLFLDGKPEAPLIYHLVGRMSTEPWLPEAQDHLHDFAQAGYRLFGCEVGMGSIWKPEGLDVDHIRRQLSAIRSVREDAAVLLRITLEPPSWWLDQHPDELIHYAMAPGTDIPEPYRMNPGQRRRVSYASEVFVSEMSEQLTRLVRLLGASPEGGAVFALMPVGGEWGEWFYPGFEFEPDTGPAMTRHFREWLRARYTTDEALQEAWKDPLASLNSAGVPGLEERFQASEKEFRNPAEGRKAIDYYKCHQELVADVPVHFCRIAKKYWPRPVVVGTFHAYLFHLTHQASGGHLEMQRVLSSKDIDFLSSPFSYEFNARFMGGTGHFRCLTETVRRHGKLWLSENDHPTLVGDHFGRPGPFAPANIEDSIATMRRNTAHCYTFGQGAWWFDFGPAGGNGMGGWWDRPELMAEAASELTVARNLMEIPYEPAADVLLVYDTECFYHLAPMYLGVYQQSNHWFRTETLSFEALNETVADAFKSGAAIETVHLADLDRIDLSRYRVVVFAFTPLLTEQQRQVLQSRVITPGRTIVWVYAPGYTDGNCLDEQRISEITGIKIEKSNVNLPPELIIREGVLAPGFPETRVATTIKDAWTIPTFKVIDSDATVLGYYSGSRDIALAQKMKGDTSVWYCALPFKNPNVMREVFRQGGAHIYNEKNDVLHAGGSVIWIHTETGGPRSILLRNGKELHLDLAPWSTIVMNSETGESLFP